MYENKIVMKVSQEEYDRLMKQTKCWTCANAYGGCNWSKRFQPVKGWKADKRKVENKNAKYVTYFVNECPQYDCDVVVIKPKPVPEPVPAKSVAKKKPKPKPANVKRGTKGTHIYMMMRNGMFQLFDSINDVSTYIKEHDADVEMKMSSVRNRICEALKASPKRYFYCVGHMFKKYEE